MDALNQFTQTQLFRNIQIGLIIIGILVLFLGRKNYSDRKKLHENKIYNLTLLIGLGILLVLNLMGLKFDYTIIWILLVNAVGITIYLVKNII